MTRYYHPDEFAELKRIALGLGFVHVEAGPLVRSSYHAHEQADAAQAALTRLRARRRTPGTGAAWGSGHEGTRLRLRARGHRNGGPEARRSALPDRRLT